jgi:phage N-6-adenine-methyltransferase
MTRTKTTLTVAAPEFSQAVTKHVKDTERTIAKLQDPKAAKELLAKTSTLAAYARQIEADTDTINRLTYAKLLLCAKVGHLLPATPRGERGQGRGGNKSTPPGGSDLFGHTTLAAYRKLASGNGHVKQYWNESAEFQHEMTQADCLRYIKDPEVWRKQMQQGKTDAMSEAARKAKSYTGWFEWYTPAEYIEAVRNTLGSIDLDPASCQLANKSVKAKKYYTEKRSGLNKPWNGNVFLNPPYARGIITEFADKFISELDAGNISTGIVLVNANTDCKWWHHLARHCSLICFTQGRIKFDCPESYKGPSGGNVTGQSFLYYGHKKELFRKNFEQFGLVFPPS